MMNYLTRQELVSILAKDGQKKIIHVRPDGEDPLVFKLFSNIPGTFFITEANRPPVYVDPDELPDAENPSYLGRILFDEEGHWIYDGDQFEAGEQEQLAKFIRQ